MVLRLAGWVGRWMDGCMGGWANKWMNEQGMDEKRKKDTSEWIKSYPSEAPGEEPEVTEEPETLGKASGLMAGR